MVHNAVLVEPELRAMLAEAGRTLPRDLFTAIRAVPGHSIAAVSDYGGFEPAFRYETYVTYFVDINSAWRVTDALDEFKKQHGIAKRSMVFKSRNDRRKAPHYGTWIRAFAALPGLCVAICWDKAGNYGPREAVKKFKDELVSHAIQIKPEVALRMIKKIGWLAVVGHLLKPDDKLVWISDHDDIMNGPTMPVTQDAFNALAEVVIPSPIAAMGHCTPLDDEHETLLTLPDLIAGTLASSLPHPYGEGRLSFNDDVTRDIVHALAEFDDARDSSATRCRLLTLVFVPSGDEIFLRSPQLSLLAPGNLASAVSGGEIPSSPTG